MGWTIKRLVGANLLLLLSLSNVGCETNSPGPTGSDGEFGYMRAVVDGATWEATGAHEVWPTPLVALYLPGNLQLIGTRKTGSGRFDGIMIDLKDSRR